MRIAELWVKGFRSLSDVHLDLHDLSILIGRNNAGKSNVLSAINLLLAGSTRDISPADFHGPAGGQVDEALFEAVVHPVQKYLELSAQRHRTKIADCISDDQLHIRRRATRVPLALEPIEIWNPSERKYTLPTGIDSALKQILPEPILIEAFKDPAEEASPKSSAPLGKLLKLVMERVTEQVAGELERALASAEGKFNTREEVGRTIDDRPEELRRIEERVRQHVQSIFEGADVRLRFGLPGVSDLMGAARIESKDQGVWTPLSLKGQGFQRTVYMALLQALAEELRASTEAQLFRPFILLVEEPEAFLHPALQREMGSTLERISQSNQVVLASHSPLLVTPRHVGDVIVLRQRKATVDGSTYTVCHAPQPETSFGEDDRQLIRLLQFTSSAEYLFADCILVVEGISDHVLLEAVWSVLRDSICTGGPLVLGIIEAGNKTVVPIWIAYLQRMGLRTCGVVDLDFLWNGAGQCLGADSELSQFCQSFWSRAQSLGIAEEKGKCHRVTDKRAAFALVHNELEGLARSIGDRLRKESDIWVLREGEMELYFGLSRSSKSSYMEAGRKVRSKEVSAHQEISDVLEWAVLAAHAACCEQGV